MTTIYVKIKGEIYSAEIINKIPADCELLPLGEETPRGYIIVGKKDEDGMIPLESLKAVRVTPAERQTIISSQRYVRCRQRARDIIDTLKHPVTYRDKKKLAAALRVIGIYEVLTA